MAEILAANELELSEREILICERDLQVQQQRWEEDMELRQTEIREEIELRRLEYQRLERIDAEKTKQENYLVAGTKIFADSAKHVFVKMTDDPVELPTFFASIENLYQIYEIPNDLQAKLLLPLLTKQACSVTNRLSLRDLDNYDQIMQNILLEFRLTSREYLVRFLQLKKQPDESYIYFCSRRFDTNAIYSITET